MTREAILKEVLQLAPDDRVKLIDDIWGSFGDEAEALALTPAQALDLRMRLAEDQAGKSNRIPLDVAIERLNKTS
jgi:putative addiction module component (TIGR02574 family)